MKQFKIVVKNYYMNNRNNSKTIDIETVVNENDVKEENGYYFITNDKVFNEIVNQAKETLNKQKKTYKQFYSYEIIDIKSL